MSVQVDIIEYEINVDIVDDEIIVNIVDGITIYENGVKVANVRSIDFIDGTNTTVSVTQQGNRVIVQIDSSGSGSSGVDSFNARTGVVLPLQADYDSFFLTPAEIGNLMATLVFNAEAGATLTMTNQTANEEYFYQDNDRMVQKFNAAIYNYVRVVVNVKVASGSGNSPRFYPKYKTNFSTGDAISTFTTVGSGSGAEAASLAAVDVVASDWIALDVNNKADVDWAIAQHGGNGSADPAVAIVMLQFKI